MFIELKWCSSSGLSFLLIPFIAIKESAEKTFSFLGLKVSTVACDKGQYSSFLTTLLERVTYNFFIIGKTDTFSEYNLNSVLEKKIVAYI